MSVAELEENEVIEDEVIEVEQVDEEVDNDQTEETEANVSEDGDEPEEDADEFEISLDGESLTPKEDKEDNGFVKDLRKRQKEMSKENRELKSKLELIEQSNVESSGVKPLTKPTLEDFDYDSDSFEKALDEYYIHKTKNDEAQAQMQAEQDRQTKEWNDRLNSYEISKKELKVKDYDDAWESVEGLFDQTQQGVIIHASDNPALAFYAIGKNERMAKELANIKDPVKFAFAVSKMESKLKYSKRKAKPAPEGTVKSSGGKGVGTDKTLERLETEADRTGNRTKVAAYKRKLREQRSK